MKRMSGLRIRFFGIEFEILSFFNMRVKEIITFDLNKINLYFKLW